MQTFISWLKTADLNESETRYSVEVNYRSRVDEILDSAAKIMLGYVSAALKKNDFHVKQVFEEEPIRILISSRKWDDGEWVCVVSWNSEKKCYVISKGYYNKDKKTVSVQDTKSCDAENASEIANKVRNLMHELKDEPDRRVTKLKPLNLKRGPK